MSKPSGRFWLLAIIAAVGLALLQQVWHWEVERVEVPPGQFIVRIHRWGANLPEDEIVARDASFKGVMLDVLGEGRHFLNPIFWSHEFHEIKEVPAGKCLVLTRKFGTKIPDDRMSHGDILARQDKVDPFEGERGILRDVLPPGSYRINPHAYSYEEIPAVEIAVNQVGVRTLKVGADPRDMPADASLGSYVVADGYRGVQKSTVPPGTYYINPHAETITPVDVRAHRVELQDIAFPSRDGFILKPRVVVEYAAIAEKTPEMVARLADDGLLHQADATMNEQQDNEILQKVLLPHIRGYARIEGSNFDAREFILSKADAVAAGQDATPVDNAREKMQTALLQKVKPRCERLGVELRAVTLAALQPPAELAEQIAQRELARVEREKNEVLVRQHKAQQELAAKQGLKKQATEKVAAETRLIQAKTKLDQSKEVETSRLTQELANAKIELEAAKSEAAAKLANGKAQAAVIDMQNEAEISGLRTAVQGFANADNFAQYHVMAKLAPALAEIFASDDSDFARLFAAYMSQKAGSAGDGSDGKNGSNGNKTGANGGSGDK